jgi:hypothetical protein
MYERRILESKKEGDSQPGHKDSNRPQKQPGERDKGHGKPEHSPADDRSQVRNPAKRGGDDPTTDW